MIDIKFLRENPDIVKENIKKKFQNHKLVLVDEVIELDVKNREVKLKGDELRSMRNSLSSQIGNLMKNGQRDEAEKIKQNKLFAVLSALKYIVEKGTSPEYGARPLKRLIQQEIEDQLTDLLLAGELQNSNVVVNVNENGLVFTNQN